MDVVSILAVRQKRSDDRQGVARRQPFRRARELTANLDIRLDGRSGRQLHGHRGRHSARIAEQPHRPEPDIPIGVIECLQGHGLVQSPDEVQGPEGLERGLTGPVHDKPMQLGSDRRVLAVADQPQGRLANPPVGVGQALEPARAWQAPRDRSAGAGEEARLAPRR